MRALVIGATGATGRLLVRQLLDRGLDVRAIVRSADKLSESVRNHGRLSLVHASVLELSESQMHQEVGGCQAVGICLGHSMDVKGIWGPPYRLVTQATARLCQAIRRHEPTSPVRLVLMNTAGYCRRAEGERVSLAQQAVLGLLRLLLPPHVDNEQAADHLQSQIGVDDRSVQWAVVRPDTLIDEDALTGYDLFPSPTRSAIFNAGTTSRLQVAHFMAELMTGDPCWDRWKGQMPVIYKADKSGA